MANVLSFQPARLPLASEASNEKSANNLIEVLSYVMNHFSLASFKIFPCRPKSLIIMCVLVWVTLSPLTWSVLSFLDVYSYVFHQTWESFRCYFFEYRFSSPAGALPMHILLSLLVSHTSPKLCTLLCNLLSVSQNTIIPTVLFSSSWILFSTSLKPVFESSSRFLYFCCCNFQLLDYFLVYF